MDQLTIMHIFTKVADLSSFTQVAEQMNLPKASISNAIRHLETQLGTRLLHRTTRRVQMTQDGMVYYERCKDILADMDDLQQLFASTQATLTGRLRVDMSIGLAKNILLPALPSFMQQHPQLQIEVSSTDRRVDLVREGVDCVIRVGALQDSSLIARPLGLLSQVNCASKSYLDNHGTPTTLDDLQAHHIIHYVPALGNKSPGFEYWQPETGIVAFLPCAGNLTVNNTEAYLAACLAGLGIIQVPSHGIRPHLANGQLVEILPEYRAAPMPVSLLYANRRQQPRRVQLFMNWVESILKPYLTST